MFRVKICGLTNFDDARAACEAGADALGFNFFSQSRRFIEPQLAGQIARELPAHITKVGVFVNHAPREIAAIITAVNLDAIQLHGNEPPEIIAQLPPAFVIRAWPATIAKFGELAGYLDKCKAAGRLPDALLFDTPSATEFGGTGRMSNWDEVALGRQRFAGYPIILAGGLTPQNINRAIAAVHPDAVDVASGVEATPRHKSADLMTRFVSEAKMLESE